MLKCIEYKLDRIGIEKQNRVFFCNLTAYFVV